MKIVTQSLALMTPSIMKRNQLLTSSCLALAGALLLSGCQSTSVSQSNMATVMPAPSAAKAALDSVLKKQRRQSFSYHSNLEISQQQPVEVPTNQLAASNYVEEHCEEKHDQAYAALILQAEKQNKALLTTDFDATRETIKQSYFECVKEFSAWSDHQYDSDVPVAPYYQELFDNYDDKSKPLSLKKAQLLDEYLLKPLSIDAQGVYQPMAGKATMLASVQYRARNHQSSINQPIYVDFKNGDVYLWADNFAMFNSELLDDKLGTKWRNKWLKVAIDDGTLPKGFGSEMIKTHFAALDFIYDAAPVGQFDYIAPTTLSALSPKLPAHQLSPMLQSDKVIRRLQSHDDYEASYQQYMQVFYDRISKQYPELITDNDSDVANEADGGSEMFTSKAIVQKILTMMKDQMDSAETEETTEESNEELIEEINAATYAEVQELYGFDKRGQLKWQHIHRQLANASPAKSEQSMKIDVLQQYSTVNTKDRAFPNLPNDVQTPNASNSIDLREYGPELLQHYRDGNGTAVGKMIFNMLPMEKDRLGVVE